MKFAVTLLQSLLVLLPLSALGQKAELNPLTTSPTTGVFFEEAPIVTIRAINRDMQTYVAPPAEFWSSVTPTANIDVTYIGFPANAQTAFQFAVDIWEMLITSTVTIKVTARWTPLDPGVLGSASAASLVRDFSGAPEPATWYPITLAEKLAGGDLNHVDSADINANFNSSQANWYFGTDGNPPSGQFDLVTVVLHELGHGLGFFGSMNVTGGMGSWGAGTGFPFIYDRFAENGAGQQLINTTIFPNPSAALASELTSDNIFFDGPNANAGNGGSPPKLYTPSTWNSGSSFSHLDEATFPAGNPNSLMTPAVGMAEAIHSAGDVTLGMFEDWGWTTTPPPPSSIKWEEVFGGTTPPAGWRVVDNDGSGSAFAFIQGLTFMGDTLNPQAGTSFWWSNFNNANGSGLIDEWLIGPRVPNIVDGDSLYFYAGAIDQGFDDSLRVFISTTDSLLGSFDSQIGYFKVEGPFGTWHEYGFDLSAFDGEDIFVAVNYFIVDGGPFGNHSDNVWVDHFLITTDNPTSVNEVADLLPDKFLLQQNYPNPFNPSTTIQFAIPENASHSNMHVSLQVFDILGREVATLVNEELHQGTYVVTWDASTLARQPDGRRLDSSSGLASGVYLYRLQTGNMSLTKSMVLVK
jgi:hypothetical protein